MNEDIKRTKPLNFNTLLNIIVIAAIGYVGKTVTEGNDKLGRLSERLAVMEATNMTKLEQLNRIEVQLTHQQGQINDMQLELVRMKGNKP